MKVEIEINDLKKELSDIIRETVKEEMFKLRAELIPYISDREQEEINKIYEKPSGKIAKSKNYDMAD
jgi:hypothetical protein